MADEKSVETAKPAAPGKSTDAPGHAVPTMSVRDYAAEKKLLRWQLAALTGLTGWATEDQKPTADLDLALKQALTGRI